MPFAAPVPCRGCRQPVTKSGYCAACKAKGEGREQRPTSAQRGYGSRWQKARFGYLRAHPMAVDWFGDHGGREFGAQALDHIIPHKGDMTLFWDSDNWQGLTERDHDRKTALENSGPGRWVNAGTADKPAMRWERTG